jgi:hypothetical protein
VGSQERTLTMKHLRVACVNGRCRRSKRAGVTGRCVHVSDEGGVKSGATNGGGEDTNTKISQYFE